MASLGPEEREEVQHAIETMRRATAVIDRQRQSQQKLIEWYAAWGQTLGPHGREALLLAAPWIKGAGTKVG